MLHRHPRTGPIQQPSIHDQISDHKVLQGGLSMNVSAYAHIVVMRTQTVVDQYSDNAIYISI
jgi:hypothetical protein